MDFKKKLRAFFTLTRKSDGFTLVELVVVIAVLGILGGVAVPAYGGYITKTNETADRQMIGDIEHALTLGAYSGRYTPGTVVGAVGISKDEAATAVTNVEDATDIEDMMVQAFGESWKETLKLKSDYFAESDTSKMISAIKNNPEMFASVPGSSFYSSENGTTAVVSEVDDLATDLNNVLGGLGANLSKFWGKSFTDENGALSNGGVTTDMWKNDDQMAANLTVFAVANEVVNSTDKVDNWTASWTNEGSATVSGVDGYAADLAMQYAKCVAFQNYMVAQGGRNATTATTRFNNLRSAMQDMANSNGDKNYLEKFNDAISDFWSGMDTARANWQAIPEGGGKSQAEKDAEAFIASMMAVNSLEDTYVSAGKTDVLGSANAFATAGAAAVLDAMVNYAKLGENLPDAQYLLVLSVAEDGTPTITPTLKEK